MQQAVACYREFAPCEALRQHVRAFFSFVPTADSNPPRRPITREILFGEGDSFCSPLFADGHVSMVFSLGQACREDGLWRRNPVGPYGKVIGAMTSVGTASDGERPEMAGVYFRATQAVAFTHIPASELTDRIVAIEDLWGAAGSELATELSEVSEAARMDRLESALLRRVEARRPSTVTVDVPCLAAWVLRQDGRLTVQRLAEAAGVSRQHLTRVFREHIGVTPKLYCRLARFQSGLAYAGCGKRPDWAQIAFGLGYADQSHMISEFRQFSSLTPQMLVDQQWFHPFIERARARQARRLSGQAGVMLKALRT